MNCTQTESCGCRPCRRHPERRASFAKLARDLEVERIQAESLGVPTDFLRAWAREKGLMTRGGRVYFTLVHRKEELRADYEGHLTREALRKNRRAALAEGVQKDRKRDETLAELLRIAKERFDALSPEERERHREEQLVSFAYGNGGFSDPSLTKEKLREILRKEREGK